MNSIYWRWCVKNPGFCWLFCFFLFTDMRTTSRTESLGNYRTGYNECATEVMRYLSHTTAAPHNNPSVKNRLLDHVSSCVQRVNNTLAPAVPPRVAPTSTYTPSAAAATGSCHTLSLPSSTPHASLPGSSGNLSSFRPVRKSPTEAFEAPKCDYSASSVNCSLPSPPNAACFSPVDFHLNFLSSFPVQSPSSSQYSSSSESRSVTPTHSADNGSAPAYLAAMDIEEIRAKYGNVWRPWWKLMQFQSNESSDLENSGIELRCVSVWYMCLTVNLWMYHLYALCT